VSIDQHLLEAVLVDELRIDIVPILLCVGLRLFDKRSRSPIKLEQVKVTLSKDVTHLRYSIRRRKRYDD
jgi:dihydrofolate reductase